MGFGIQTFKELSLTLFVLTKQLHECHFEMTTWRGFWSSKILSRTPEFLYKFSQAYFFSKLSYDRE